MIPGTHVPSFVNRLGEVFLRFLFPHNSSDDHQAYAGQAGDLPQRQMSISKLKNCFVPIDRRQFLELRHIFAARNLFYRFPCLLICDSDCRLVRNVEAVLIAKLFMERKQLIPVNQCFRKGDFNQLGLRKILLPAGIGIILRPLA